MIFLLSISWLGGLLRRLIVRCMASLAYQSYSTFSEHFTGLVKMTPMEFVTTWHIQQAVCWLKLGNTSKWMLLCAVATSLNLHSAKHLNILLVNHQVSFASRNK